MTITLTLEQALALNPCSPAALRIKALLEPGRAYTAREAADAGFSLPDLMWVLRKLAQTDPTLARLELHLGADYAERVLHLYEEAYPDDTRPRNAIQAARDYADGKINADALAAYAAYAAASYAYAAYAAYAAASYAYAAYAADAAASAAYAASSAASSSAAYAAERAWQLNRLLERLEDGQL